MLRRPSRGSLSWNRHGYPVGYDGHMLGQQAECSRPFPADQSGDLGSSSWYDRFFHSSPCNAIPTFRLFYAYVTIGLDIQRMVSPHPNKLVLRNDRPRDMEGGSWTAGLICAGASSFLLTRRSCRGEVYFGDLNCQLRSNSLRLCGSSGRYILHSSANPVGVEST